MFGGVAGLLCGWLVLICVCGCWACVTPVECFICVTWLLVVLGMPVRGLF